MVHTLGNISNCQLGYPKMMSDTQLCSVQNYQLYKQNNLSDMGPGSFQTSKMGNQAMFKTVKVAIKQC